MAVNKDHSMCEGVVDVGLWRLE